MHLTFLVVRSNERKWVKGTGKAFPANHFNFSKYEQRHLCFCSKLCLKFIAFAVVFIFFFLFSLLLYSFRSLRFTLCFITFQSVIQKSQSVEFHFRFYKLWTVKYFWYLHFKRICDALSRNQLFYCVFFRFRSLVSIAFDYFFCYFN